MAASGGTVSAAERTQRVAAAQRSAMKRRKVQAPPKAMAPAPAPAKPKLDKKKQAALDKLRKHMDTGKPMKVKANQWDGMLKEARTNEKWEVTDDGGTAKIKLPDGRTLNLERE
jgi:hypothetical protein